MLLQRLQVGALPGPPQLWRSTHRDGLLACPLQHGAPGLLLHRLTLPTLPAVKVINCDGTAEASNVLAGLDWLSANVKFPAVASMSLGADTPNQALDDAVTALIQQGVLAVIAAGNYNQGGHGQMRLLQQAGRVLRRQGCD